MSNYINTGTASATNASKTVTFASVSVSLFSPGDQFLQGGSTGIVDTVDADTSTVTLVDNWGGTTSSASAYIVLPTPDDIELASMTRTIAQSLATGALQDIAGATFADDDIIQAKSGALINRTVAQFLTDLAAAGAVTLTGSQTLTNKTFGGVTSGSYPAAGNIGERKFGQRTTALDLTTATTTNVTSIDLPAGIWLVWGNSSATGILSRHINVIVASPTSLPGNGDVNRTDFLMSITNSITSSAPVGPILVNQSVDQTWYLNTYCDFTGSATVTGILYALRIA